MSRWVEYEAHHDHEVVAVTVGHARIWGTPEVACGMKR